MCTVTYIPVPGCPVITANRDEQRGRPPALAPACYAGQTGQLLFPKDALAGGTWFVLHEKGTALVLLNGACDKHVPQPPYRKSTGLVLLELADSDNSIKAFKNMNLKDIEPFTAILLEANALVECRWDGKKKTHAFLDAGLPHIWSSVTLYDPPTIQKRRFWLEKWLSDNPAPGRNDILAFHRFAGDGDPSNDLLMNRGGKMLTVSITSLQVTSNAISPSSASSGPFRMYYHDLLSGRVTDETFHSTQSMPAVL